MRRSEWLRSPTISVFLTLSVVLTHMMLPIRTSAEPAPALAAAPPYGAGDYRVGPGDLLRVNVFDHPELAADLRVSQSGNLTFPLLGQLAVAGKSPHDIESALVQGLASGGFVREPQVAVLVIDYQSQKISVMG